jgi:hypothetical protein
MSEQLEALDARLRALGQHKANKVLDKAVVASPNTIKAFLCIGSVAAMLAAAEAHAEAMEDLVGSIEGFLDEAEEALDALASESGGE